MRPDQFVGTTRYVTGREALMFRQAAKIASDVFQKPIQYESGISVEAWVRKLKAHRLENDRRVKHASVLAQAFGKTKMSFGQVTDEVLAVSGVKPISSKDFLSRIRPVFAA
jgi:hypothetical protein